MGNSLSGSPTRSRRSRPSCAVDNRAQAGSALEVFGPLVPTRHWVFGLLIIASIVSHTGEYSSCLKKNAEELSNRNTSSVDGIAEGLLDANDGRPRARRNLFHRSDRHVLKLHPPLSKAPLRVNLVVKWEELHGVSEAVPGTRLEAHIAVIFEVRHVPLDSLRDFLGQLAPPDRLWLRLVILGGELSVHLLPMGRSWTFNFLYAPASTLPSPFHSRHPLSSVPSQPRCWKGSPETGDKRWVITSE